MRHLLMITTLPALLIALPVRADNLKTADEVIEKYAQAIGGKDKWDSIKTIRLTGKILSSGGPELPAIMEVKQPDKVRMEFTMQGTTGIQAYDGKEGWFVMPFMGKPDPEKMPPDMSDIVKDQGDLAGPLLDYKKKGNQVELAGTEDVDGTPAYKLKVTKKDGSTQFHFINKETFLPMGQKGKRKIFGMEQEFEAYMSDFKDVEGRKMPHTIQNKSTMGTQTMKFEKIEINPTIDDSRFAMPAVEKKEPEGEKKE